MLAKQSWRLLQDSESLSARILKAVYYPQSDLLEAELGSHPSQEWRQIFEGTIVLKQGLIRRIGNGQGTHIWNQNWILRDHMLRALHPRSQKPPVLVSDLMDHSIRSWDKIALREHLQEIDVHKILQIPLSSYNRPNTWAWHYERSGNFSIRSVYILLMETKRTREAWLYEAPGNSNTEGDK